jgi:hypothetical protein
MLGHFSAPLDKSGIGLRASKYVPVSKEAAHSATGAERW